jgi:DNA uptake protein ComE-like DNA-binding protein
MIDFFMVDVKDIQVTTTDHNFSPVIIENLANAMLASGGLIKPLILKQVGLQNYQLIDGHLEYYAALQAKAKDPRKGEMVNAFVISPDQEDLVRQQVIVLQSAHSLAHHIENATNTPANTSPQSEKSQDLPSNNNLSVTDYTHLQSQLDAKLDAKFSNYQQAIQNQLRQNQQDLQIVLQKMQSAWEATLNNQLRQQQEAIQAQLRSHSSPPSSVATSVKISDPLSEVREKTPVTKNGLSQKININEVETYKHFEELQKEYKIKKFGLGETKLGHIIAFRQKQEGGKILSLEQLSKLEGITTKNIKEWSDYLTC